MRKQCAHIKVISLAVWWEQKLNDLSDLLAQLYPSTVRTVDHNLAGEETKQFVGLLGKISKTLLELLTLPLREVYLSLDDVSQDRFYQIALLSALHLDAQYIGEA